MGACISFYLILIWFAFFLFTITLKSKDNEECDKHYMKLEIAAIENETKHKVNKVNKTWFQVWVGHLIIKNQVGLTTTRSRPILFLFSTERERERCIEFCTKEEIYVHHH